MEAFTSNQNPYSASKQGENFYAKKQLYINPSSFIINEKKLIQSTQTKGGFSVQYWGEDLTTIQASGTTGSSGIEGIKVLLDIYRHEQNQYRIILAERQRKLAEAALKATEETNSLQSAGGALGAIADLVTGGAFTQAVSGVKNAIEIITDPFDGRQDLANSSFSTVPTLGAFATNIDMYFQGEFFRGYFTNFSITESGEKPGIFDYGFGFTVTRKYGNRTNFMPWHRNPLSPDGETQMSQKVTESKGTDGAYNLSFPIRDSSENQDTFQRFPLDLSNDRGIPGIDSSTFINDVIENTTPNLVPNNRRAFIKNGK